MRETNEVRRVRETKRGGREKPTSIFSTAISPWQFVDTAVWMKMGIQIKILFRLGFRKGVEIKRVEYLSKNTDMVRRETEKDVGEGEHLERNGQKGEGQRHQHTPNSS